MADRIAKVSIVFSGITDNLKNSIDNIKTNMENMKKTASKVAGNMQTLGASISAPIIGIGAVAVNSARQFETAFTNIGTLVNNDTKKIAEFEKGIKSMLREIPKSADDLGASAYNIVSAGITDTTKALDVLKSSSKLAIAGLGETEEAVNIITSAINAFGKDASESDKIADTFFKGVQAGKTTVSELAQGFGAVAPVANEIGLSFEELISNTAALTTTGLKASESYRQIRQILVGLIKPSADLQKVMELAGITNVKAEISANGLNATLSKLRNTAEANGISFDVVFGSVEAMNASLALTGEIGNTANTVLENIRNGSDSVTEGFENQKKTLDSQYQLLKNNLNVTMGDLGKSILPLVVTAVKLLTNVARILGETWINLSPIFQNTIVIVASLVAGFGTMLMVVGSVTKAVISLHTAFSGISTIMPIIKTLTLGLNGSFATMLGTVGILTAKIVALIAVFKTAYEIGKMLSNIPVVSKVIDMAVSPFADIGLEQSSLTLEAQTKLTGIRQAQTQNLIINNPIFDREQKLNEFQRNLNNNQAPAPVL